MFNHHNTEVAGAAWLANAEESPPPWLVNEPPFFGSPGAKGGFTAPAHSQIWTPELARRKFGLATAADLPLIGLQSKSARGKAVKAGHLLRLGRGIYALPHANADAVRAVGLGGAIACESACKLYGMWVPHRDLHILTRRNQAIVKARNVTVHSRRHAPDLIPTPWDAVHQVLRFHDAETGLMVLESALNMGLIEVAEVEALIRDLPYKKQRVLGWATEHSQSGLETRVRLFFLSNRIPVRPQVQIPTVGWVDMVVGSSLIVECNGDFAHSTREQRNRDYMRIQRARMLGYETVSLSYSQIFEHWEETQAYLLALIRERKHLKPPVPLVG